MQNIWYFCIKRVFYTAVICKDQEVRANFIIKCLKVVLYPVWGTWFDVLPEERRCWRGPLKIQKNMKGRIMLPRAGDGGNNNSCQSLLKQTFLLHRNTIIKRTIYVNTGHSIWMFFLHTKSHSGDLLMQYIFPPLSLQVWRRLNVEAQCKLNCEGRCPFVRNPSLEVLRI